MILENNKIYSFYINRNRNLKLGGFKYGFLLESACSSKRV
jgi:hypothetical protein